MDNNTKDSVYGEETLQEVYNDVEGTKASAKEVVVQEEKPEHKKERKTLTRFALLALIGAVAAWIILIIMLTNTASAFGEVISIATAFEFLFSIFSIHYGVIYITLAKLALSILYIIFLIIAVKNVILITRDLPKTFSHKLRKPASEQPEGVSTIYSRTSSVLAKFCIFLIVTYILSGDSFTTGSWIGVVVVGLYAMLVQCLITFPQRIAGSLPRDKETWIGYGLKVVRQLLILSCVFCLAFILMAPAGYDLVFGVQVLFGGFFHGVSGFFITFYSAVGENILKIIALIKLIALIGTVLTEHITISNHIAYSNERNIEYANDRLKTACLHILIVLAVAAVLTCVSSAIGETGTFYFGEESLFAWWNLIKDNIFPAVLASAAGILIATYMKEEPQRR